MDSVFSSPDLEDRLVAVTESVAGEIDDRFRERLCALIKRELNLIYRAKVSASDVAQQGLIDFFTYVSGKEDLEVTNWRKLWSLLRVITMRRMLKEIKKAGHEVECPKEFELPEPISAANARLLGDVLERVLAGLPLLEPEILQLILLNGYRVDEVVDIAVKNLPDSYLPILQLRLQGHTEREIAEKVKLGREAVRFRIRRIRERLGEKLREDAREPTTWAPT